MSTGKIDITPRLLLFGLTRQCEFSDWLHSLPVDTVKIHVPLVFSDSSLPDQDDSVQGVLFFQSYPDQFTPDLFKIVRRTYPTLPILLVLGACCEGEQRTGRPLQGAFRIYAAQWNTADTEQINVLFDGPGVARPWHVTAGDDEILLAKYHNDRTIPPKNKNCLIVSRFGPLGNDFDMNRLLADRLQHDGNRFVISGAHSPGKPDHVLADADDSPFERIMAHFRQLKTLFPEAETTIFLHSPRVEERHELLAAGATRVLAKPFCFL